VKDEKKKIEKKLADLEQEDAKKEIETKMLI